MLPQSKQHFWNKKKVVHLLSIDEAVKGLAGTPSFGVRPSSISNSAPSTSANVISGENQNDTQIELDSLTENVGNDDSLIGRPVQKNKTLDKNSLL